VTRERRRYAGSARRGPRRLGWVLLGSFALTISSFLASTIVVRIRARGIGGAAESIATNAGPSIVHLSNARTKLRHLELALDDYTDRIVAHGRDPHGEQGILRELSEVEQDWEAYRELPAYPDELELQAGVNTALAGVSSDINLVLARLRSHDDAGAEQELKQVAQPAIDLLDERLGSIVAVDGRFAAELAEQIVSIRDSLEVLATVLDVICALFAGVAAMAAIRVVAQYATLMEYRVAELEHFAGRVAHDIRSPLTSVGLALEVAARSAQLEPRARESLKRGTRTLQRVGQLVDGLLVFARSGAVPTGEVRAELKTVVDGVVEEFLPVARSKDIELQVEPFTPGEVACSPGVLTSLVANLVGNAIKFMGGAPLRRVLVRVRDGAARIRIEVEDSGAGIAPADQGRIFDPYVRASDSSVPGLGLGLATVRRLAEAHGGSVGVDSREGVGSLFWVELPKAPPAPGTT
jgi:signal transduction histidine kinase